MGIEHINLTDTVHNYMFPFKLVICATKSFSKQNHDSSDQAISISFQYTVVAYTQ